MPKLNDSQKTNVDDAPDEGGLTVVEPGVYALVLNKVEEKKGNKGPYWEWEFTIYADSDGEELDPKPRLWEITSLSAAAAWRLKQMFAAFGVDTDTDTDDLLGESIWANVGVEIAQQGSRAGQQRNTFASAIAAEEG